MMKKNILTAILFTILFLVACSHEEAIKRVVSDETVEFANNYLQQLLEKNYDYVYRYSMPEIRDKVSQKQLDELTERFPDGKLISTEIIGAQKESMGSVLEERVILELEFEDGWAVANIVVIHEANKRLIHGFHFSPTLGSQKELNKFSLSGKHMGYYLVLLLMIAIPVFILITLVYCIKTPIPQKKWLWVLFIFVGLGAFKLNWTTGEYFISIFSVNLLGAGMSTMGIHGPWIVTIAFPLGAILFWVKRKHSVESLTGDKQSENK